MRGCGMAMVMRRPESEEIERLLMSGDLEDEGGGREDFIEEFTDGSADDDLAKRKMREDLV